MLNSWSAGRLFVNFCDLYRFVMYKVTLMSCKLILRNFFFRSKTCTKVTSTSSPHAPYACSRQENPNLYSCASVPTDPNIRRICPCRDFLRGQTALCSSCIWFYFQPFCETSRDIFRTFQGCFGQMSLTILAYSYKLHLWFVILSFSASGVLRVIAVFGLEWVMWGYV